MGAQILYDCTTSILHQVHEDIHALQLIKSMDTFHLVVVFEKVNDGLLNTEKHTWKIGVKSIPPKNVKTSNYPSIILFY